jgi:uncharacterized protein (DUF952 family)
MQTLAPSAWPRWVFHLLLARDAGAFPYAPPSLRTEGFIHASCSAAVLESARLYFAADAELCVYQIDVAEVAGALSFAATPRGPMPHIQRALVANDVVAVLTLAQFSAEFG